MEWITINSFQCCSQNGVNVTGLVRKMAKWPQIFSTSVACMSLSVLLTSLFIFHQLRNREMNCIFTCLSHSPKLCQTQQPECAPRDFAVKTFDCVLEQPLAVMARLLAGAWTWTQTRTFWTLQPDQRFVKVAKSQRKLCGVLNLFYVYWRCQNWATLSNCFNYHPGWHPSLSGTWAVIIAIIYPLSFSTVSFITKLSKIQKKRGPSKRCSSPPLDSLITLSIQFIQLECFHLIYKRENHPDMWKIIFLLCRGQLKFTSELLLVISTDYIHNDLCTG